MPTKRPWRSKTLLSNALFAILMLHPKTAAFVSAYPSVCMLVICGLNFALRLINHGKITVVDQ